jgi:peptidyl-prolyl cis-trans isomerase D
MLKFLSKQQRARNAFIIFFCFLMVITLVIFFGLPVGDWLSKAWKSDSDSTLANPAEVVAEVDGEEITAGELKKALDRIAQMSQGGQGLSMMRSFSDEMLDQLIQQRIMTKEAARLGIEVSDQEVFQQIARMYPSFLDQNRRFVSFDVYRRAIERSGSTVTEFEDSHRQSLLDQKLRAYLTAGVTVTPREIEEEFTRDNTSVTIAYVVIDPKDLEKEIEVSDQEARTYFGQHKDEFKIVELERQVEYLFIPFGQLEKTVKVADKEIQQEYEQTEFQQRVGASVSQIVLPFNENNEAEVRQKADDLVKRARGEEAAEGQPAKPAEDFAKLGGKSIGSVTKDAKDTSYKQRVFTLAKTQKEVTEPIREKDAFYVLKVDRWKLKSLAEARPELLKQIRERKARTEAATLADDVKKKFDEVKDIRQVAEEFSKRLNLSADEMIRRTGFFATSDQLPEFDAYSSSFTSSVANLDQPKQIGDKIFLKDGYAIPQLLAKREPQAPQFDEVKDRVIAKIRKTKAADLARQRAQKIIEQATTVDALAKAAKAENLKLETQEDFKWGSVPKDLQRSEQLEGFALTLPANQVAKHAIKVGDKFAVAGVKARKDPDMTKLDDKERKAIRERLLSQRQNEFFQAYINDVKDKLATEGRIIVYDEVFKTVSSGAGLNPADFLKFNPQQ